jgi:hypothetical protein
LGGSQYPKEKKKRKKKQQSGERGSLKLSIIKISLVAFVNEEYSMWYLSWTCERCKGSDCLLVLVLLSAVFPLAVV